MIVQDERSVVEPTVEDEPSRQIAANGGRGHAKAWYRFLPDDFKKIIPDAIAFYKQSDLMID